MGVFLQMELREIITDKNIKSPVSEAYRTLRTNIQFSNIDQKIKTILITSSGPREGKSTTATNLAVTIAQSGKKVLLIDSDLRKPRVHQYFELPNTRGLTTVASTNEEYTSLLCKTHLENLDVLTSGPIPPNPSELLGSEKIKEIFKKASQNYDIVLLDSPPVGVVTDAAVLSTIVDGVLLICASGQVAIDAAKIAKELLQRVKANIIGIILTKVPIHEGRYYKYSYYHSYYEESTKIEKKKTFFQKLALLFGVKRKEKAM